MQYQIDFLDGSNVVVCELRAFAESPADALLGLVGNIEWPTGAVACVLDGPRRILTVSRRKRRQSAKPCGSSYKGLIN